MGQTLNYYSITTPFMKKKLTLDQLKKFFLGEAKELASPMLKP